VKFVQLLKTKSENSCISYCYLLLFYMRMVMVKATCPAVTVSNKIPLCPTFLHFKFLEVQLECMRADTTLDIVHVMVSTEA